MKYKYTYTGESPCDFITIGKHNVNKGDTVESDEPLYSPFLVELDKKVSDEKGE